LRVVTPAGDPVTLSQALSRAAVFVLMTSVGDILFRGLLLVGVIGEATGPVVVAWAALDLLLLGLLMSTMRRANGFAGMHELASGTRVLVVRRAVRLAQVSAAAPAPEPSQGASWSCPPFRVVGPLWQRENEALFLARDDDLKRDVWIHRSVHPSLLPHIERLHAHRAGSLPWLQRSESSGFHWDAYGAPRGIGLARWVSDKGRLTWKELRGVLLSLAGELERRFAGTGTAGRLSLAHVWVDVSGNVVLLDFPAEASAGGMASAVEEVTSDNWSTFMRRVVVFGSEGVHAGSVALPRVPMPGHARAIVTRLFANPPGFASADELRAALEREWARPTEVTVARRLASLAVPAAFLLLLLAGGELIIVIRPLWTHDLSRAPEYLREKARLELVSRSTPPDSASLRTIRSVAIV
ncbi:MAG: hypothetical protein ACREN5_07150, partial [Gemmatimonadales bacterium]